MEKRTLTCLSREELVQKVREHINHILRENLYELNMNEEQVIRLQQQKKELRMYLKRAGCGDAVAKDFLVNLIMESLKKLFFQGEADLAKTYLFSDIGQQNVENQFKILLFQWKKQYGKEALERLLMQEETIAKVENQTYEVTEQQIRRWYHNSRISFSYEEQLELLGLDVYAFYKGLGVIDEIRDMNVDGVSGGVSGGSGDYKSVWIFLRGKSVHLSFLDFGSEKEIERIARNCCRYHQPGEISRVKGYMVHEMADHARVVVARPDFSENWTFFIRKLDMVRKQKLETLFWEEGAEKMLALLRFLIRGCQVCGITGMQGCGKTTLLLALIEEIAPEYTLRVLELAFELHLRDVYPGRNIMTFRETTNIDGVEALEVSKKTDGTVTIIGEIVAAKVAAWMIESGQSGSLFTLFTHHAKTTEALVYTLRNSLLKEGNFHSEEIALSQVVQVVRFDIHLHMDRKGHRYIERISEIIPDGTTKKGFVVSDLICRKENGYQWVGKISRKTREDMVKWMTEAQKEEFLGMDL